MKAVWLGAGLIALGAAIVTFHDILLVFFAAAVFAVPLRGATVALSTRLRVPSALALIVTIGLIAGVAAAIVWAWQVLLAGQMAQLFVTLPPAAEALSRAAHTEPWASRIAAVLPDPAVLLTGAGSFIGGLRGFVGGTLATLLDLAIVVFAAVCFAAEPQTYVRGLLQLIPPRHRLRVDAALGEAAATIGLWLWARLISMITVGTLVALGLGLSGIPNAAALGLVAAIFSFVPNVGAIAAALPSLLLAAPLGWQHVGAVIVLYWVAHSIDDFVVIPVAERRVVHLPPALTIAAQLVLGVASGIIGIMMAAPFVAVALVLVKRLVVEGVVERGVVERTSVIVQAPIGVVRH